MQVGQGGARGVLDAQQRRPRGGGIPIEHRAGGGGLNAHRGDVVCDDVVQLACDPHAVQRHGLGAGALALPLEFGRALLQCGTLHRGRVGAVAHVVRAAEEGGVDQELDQHERDERREHPDARESVIGVCGRGLERRDQQPQEHPDDDDHAHDGRAAPVVDPRPDRVHGDEQGDVADVDLGDAQGDAGEERECHHDRDDLGESPSHRQWCGERHGVGERPRQIGGVVAVHARHGAERGAEDRGEQKPAGEPDVVRGAPAASRVGAGAGEQRVSFRT